MDETLRAADRDREQVVSILREQYAEGRLTMEEFEERSSAAWSAKTMGQLGTLTADLPVAAAPREAAWSPGRMRWITAAGVAAALVVFGIAILAGHVVLAWPTWLIVLVVLRLTGRRRVGGPRARRG